MNYLKGLVKRVNLNDFVSGSLIFLLICLLINGYLGRRAEPTPRAHDGILDLRSWDLVKQLVKLDGEWEFYWQQLLTPADFAPGNERANLSGMFVAPGSWKGYRWQDRKLTSEGFATFRLTLLLPETRQTLALSLPQIYTAYQLWADGELLCSAGRVGRSRAMMTPQYLQRVVPFQPQSSRVELVIQVSNFYHRRGGLWRPLQLGSFERVKREFDFQNIFGLLVMSSFLLMALYNLTLYKYLKSDPAPLYLGLFFLIGALRSVLVGRIFITQLYPNFPWELAMKLEYFTFYFCGPVFFRVMRCLYPKEIPAFFMRMIDGAAWLFLGFTILTPARIYSHFSPVFQFILLLSVAYIFFVLGRIAIKRREYLVLTVYMVIFLSLFNDVLFYNSLSQAEFPLIQFAENIIKLPFFPQGIPLGFISMVCFVFAFNLLTLIMIQRYFTGITSKAEGEISATAVAEHNLTAREAELVRYVVQGYSNKEIAEKLFITEGTVKSHLHKIYQKTGTKNRTELSHLVKR